uniref:Phenylalanine--tRNA ligase beta subunit n=1 Tax=Lygus hesperus TaxID=30085 RepID=A0A0A9XCI4_LYGHE
MQGNPTLRTTNCHDTIFEGKPGDANCLSEDEKRLYCERLVEKVLEEYPDLSASVIMDRLGYICEEIPQCHERRMEDCRTGDRNKPESTECVSGRRKMVYAEKLCRQVMLENPNFSPSKVKAAVMNLLNIVPEVDDVKEDDFISRSINSSSPGSLAVELSQSECNAHDTAFEIIMEDVMGTRNVCDDIKKSTTRYQNRMKDPCDDPQYKRTLYAALENSRQQKSMERKAQTDAELAHKLNCYLTDICRNLDRGKKWPPNGNQKQKDTKKSSKKTFSERNPCNVDCDNWVGGDSEFSSLNLPSSRSYSAADYTRSLESSSKNLSSTMYAKKKRLVLILMREKHKKNFGKATLAISYVMILSKGAVFLQEIINLAFRLVCMVCLQQDNTILCT